MKNRAEEGSVKRPSSCDDFRRLKLPRLELEEAMDTLDPSRPQLPDSSSLEDSPVDLSGEVKLPNFAEATAPGLQRPVLKIPSTMKCLATFDLPGKADLHQLLTNNLAQHLAVQNEKLKNNLIFGHNRHNGLLGPPPPGTPQPHREAAPHPQDLLPSQEALEEEPAREEDQEMRRATEEVREEAPPAGQEEVRGEGNTAPRVTPFSVMDILDPHKFTGKTQEDDLPDSSSDPQEEDDAYISGEALRHSSALSLSHVSRKSNSQYSPAVAFLF